METTGKIKVDSDNLMPIIKKWLYSDKDIFLREVVANASDAITKYKKLVAIGDATDDNAEAAITVTVDKENGTLSVTDTGIGMTQEEVVKYITQVAFSGASDFVAKYTATDGDGIIGHFGLGFFSTFMVSSLVEIDTLSYAEGATPVHWKSDGEEEYTISDGTKTEHGTTVTMHLLESEKEFLDKYAVMRLLKKYCGFMAYPIRLVDLAEHAKYAEDCAKAEADGTPDKAPAAPDNSPVNNCAPLYLKAPKDCTDEEYVEFYKSTFNTYEPPLFWVHLNVDFPFNLKGILYFPKQRGEIDVNQGEVKLYCKQVFIADNIKEVIPEFLILLKGVVDCPDIPLNVSRSFLQNDREIKKLSKHITKKVADKINGMFNTDREKLQNCWTDIAPFIKYGCLRNEEFYDLVRDSLLFKTTEDNYVTISEYNGWKGDLYYATDKVAQSQYIKLYRDTDKKVLLLDTFIDAHLISFLEFNCPDVKFKRVDSEMPTAANDGADTSNVAALIELFKGHVPADFTVKVQSLASDLPAVITADESKRRFNEMSKMYAQILGENGQPEANELILNLNSPVIQLLPSLEEEKQTLAVNYVLDLANVSRKQLSEEELGQFITRSVQLLSYLK